jgi:hypothetical protein
MIIQQKPHAPINPPGDTHIVRQVPDYAQVGVPEVRRYDGQKLTILLLLRERYVEAEGSSSIPRVTGNIISRFLEERQSRTLPEWQDLPREWARSS